MWRSETGRREGRENFGWKEKQTKNCKTMVLKTMLSDHELFHLLCKDKVNILSSTSDLGTGYSNVFSKVTG